MSTDNRAVCQSQPSADNYTRPERTNTDGIITCAIGQLIPNSRSIRVRFHRASRPRPSHTNGYFQLESEGSNGNWWINPLMDFWQNWLSLSGSCSGEWGQFLCFCGAISKANDERAEDKLCTSNRLVLKNLQKWDFPLRANYVYLQVNLKLPFTQ